MLEEAVKGIGKLILSSERQVLSSHAFCGLKSHKSYEETVAV